MGLDVARGAKLKYGVVNRRCVLSLNAMER